VNEEVQEIINKDFVEYEKKGGFVSESLNLLKPYIVCNEAEGAFYLFPSFQRVLDLKYVREDLKLKTDVDLRNWLLYERGVATLSGSDFGKMGVGYIRFSYAEDRDKHIIPGMKHVLKVVIELIEKSGEKSPLPVEQIDDEIQKLVLKYFGN